MNDEVKEILADKKKWKICESVHLGMDSIYLSYFRLKSASDEYIAGHADGVYKSFEKVGSVSYKYTLTPAIMSEYKENVLPKLPKGWYTVHQEWMEL